MTGDFGAAGEPNSLMLADKIEKPRHRLEPRGLTRNAAVQAHGHHARMTRAFGIEYTQGRGEVIVEVVGRAELGGRQPVVVVGKAVRNHEMRLVADRDPIGPVVRIAVGIVEEAAVLDEQRRVRSLGE